MINSPLFFVDLNNIAKNQQQKNRLVKTFDFKNASIWKDSKNVSFDDTLIIDISGNVIGLMNAELINEDMEFRVNHFEINPKYRNKGYGTQVFKQLLEVFDYISIVIDKETFPKYFYVKLGFNRIIETKDTTLLIMDKMKW